MEKKQSCEEEKGKKDDEEQKAGLNAKISDSTAEGRMEPGRPEPQNDGLEKATEEIKSFSRSIESVSDCDGRGKSQTAMLMDIANRFRDQLRPPIQASGERRIWTNIMEDYKEDPTKREEISKSSEVTVLKMVLTDGVELVLKSMKVDTDDNWKLDKVLREYYVGRTFSSMCRDNTVEIFDLKQAMIQDEAGKGTKYVFELLMEYGGKSLEKLSLEEINAVKMMYQLLTTLKIMNDQNFAHLDIKPKNATWDGERLKLIDFGTSISLRGSGNYVWQRIGKYCNRITGNTKYYTPPELLKANENEELRESALSNSIIPQKVDIFSFGITFLKMLLMQHDITLEKAVGNRAGYDKDSHKQYIDQAGNLLFKRGEGHWKDFIAQCLEYDPGKRPTYDAAIEIFKKVVADHPDLYSALKLIDAAINEHGKVMSNNLMATMHYWMKEFDVAAYYYNKCLSDPGNTRSDFFIIYNNLGNSYAELGDNEKASAHFFIALKIVEEGKVQTGIQLVCNDLGTLYVSMGKYAEAANCFQQSIKIVEKGKKDCPELATAYNNLAIAYYHIGKYKETAEIATKAIAIQTKLSGAEPHENIALSHEILGVVCDATGFSEEARNHCEKEIEIFKELYGPDDYHLATSYNNLGTLYMKACKCGEALASFEESVRIRRRVFGEDCPSLSESYQNLGNLKNEIGRYDAAICYYNQAMEFDLMKFGKLHKNIASLYTSIGIAYRNSGDLQKARTYCEESLNILIGLHEEDPRLMVPKYNNLGLIYADLRLSDEADSCFEEAIKIAEKYGHMEDELANAYNNRGKLTYDLAIASEEVSMLNSALVYFENAISIREKLGEETHVALAECYSNLGATYISLLDQARAEEFLRKAVSIYERIPIRNPHSAFAAYDNLAEVLKSSGKLAEALKCRKKALKYCTELYGKDDEKLVSNHENLAMDLYNLGKYKQAFGSFCVVLDIYKRIGTCKQIDGVLLQLADTCRKGGMVDKCLDYLYERCERFEMNKDFSSYKLACRRLINQHYELKKFRDITSWVTKQEKLLIEKSGAVELVDVVYMRNCIAGKYLVLADIGRALEYAEKAKEIDEKLPAKK
ncbi:MAG: tetratricopeptide repeat-containing serine/threonine-protein kinase [Desulfosporosinus sp.]|nr:tetratricopeptide repeat-containing serine/threonine-protein kinase [Desulfosporosinus sp.]